MHCGKTRVIGSVLVRMFVKKSRLADLKTSFLMADKSWHLSYSRSYLPKTGVQTYVIKLYTDDGSMVAPDIFASFSSQEQTLRRVFEQELGIPTEGQTVLITDHLLSSKESREKTADVSDSCTIYLYPLISCSWPYITGGFKNCFSYYASHTKLL